MDLITMGDLVPADVVAYPELRMVRVARGVELPYDAEGLNERGSLGEGRATTGTNPMLVPGSMTPSEAQ